MTEKRALAFHALAAFAAIGFATYYACLSDFLTVSRPIVPGSVVVSAPSEAAFPFDVNATSFSAPLSQCLSSNGTYKCLYFHPNQAATLIAPNTLSLTLALSTQTTAPPPPGSACDQRLPVSTVCTPRVAQVNQDWRLVYGVDSLFIPVSHSIRFDYPSFRVLSNMNMMRPTYLNISTSIDYIPLQTLLSLAGVSSLDTLIETSNGTQVPLRLAGGVLNIFIEYSGLDAPGTVAYHYSGYLNSGFVTTQFSDHDGDSKTLKVSTASVLQIIFTQSGSVFIPKAWRPVIDSIIDVIICALASYALLLGLCCIFLFLLGGASAVNTMLPKKSRSDLLSEL
ncbi:hypothetical protein BC830DRAFT_1103677 [Chytriomyces sp. MP71]|nr:hypothetical protein BC830DRAFT_1103677 [Chytriomyces sp. MP71]